MPYACAVKGFSGNAPGTKPANITKPTTCQHSRSQQLLKKSSHAHVPTGADQLEVARGADAGGGGGTVVVASTLPFEAPTTALLRISRFSAEFDFNEGQIPEESPVPYFA